MVAIAPSGAYVHWDFRVSKHFQESQMNSNLKKAVRYGLMAGAAAMLVAPAVFAQDAAQSDATKMPPIRIR